MKKLIDERIKNIFLLKNKIKLLLLLKFVTENFNFYHR